MAAFDDDIKRKPRVPGRVSGADASAGREASASPVPGKQSGTEHLPPGQNGPYGAGGPRPLPDSIRADLEAATGTNLGDVRIHNDEHGHATASDHSADAVTIGSDIFVAAGQYNPDTRAGRELIAHEVAHVVQARLGGSSKQAPTVAGAESDAEGFAGAFGNVAGAAKWKPSVGVQAGTAMRSPAGAQPAGQSTAQGPWSVFRAAVASAKPDVAWAYLRQNQDRFLKAVELALIGMSLPQSPRITWIQNGLSQQFRAALTTALGSDPLFIKLPDLVAPEDPWYAIDQNRTLTEGTPGVTVDGRDPIGPIAWEDLSGVALSTIVAKVVRDSLVRMAPRYAVQVDWKAPDPVLLEDLVTSHPMDRVTANLLLDPKVVKPFTATSASSKKKKKPAKKHSTKEDEKQFQHGVRFLNDWRWMGSDDPKLWNWVEAKDPKDARPEEVAASLWGDLNATQHAHAITQSGPYFRIDPPYARKFVADPQHEIDDKNNNNGLALAGSALATDAAIAQASDEQHRGRRGQLLASDHETLDKTLARSQRQLQRSKETFTTPKLWTLLLPAITWVNKLRDNLMSIPDRRLAELTPVIEGQSKILFEATAEIANLAGMGDAKYVQSEDSPVFGALRAYAVVCGESHLIDTARAQLEVANQVKAAVPLALLESSVRDTSTEVDHMAQGRDATSVTVEDTKQRLKIEKYRIASLRAQQAAGQNVDPNLVGNVAATLKEQAVDARVSSLYDQISELRNAASDSQSGFFEVIASAFSSNIRVLPSLISEVLGDLIATVEEPHRRVKAQKLKEAGSDTNAQTQVLNEVAQLTERNLSEFIKRHDLQRRMEMAQATIEKQMIRTAAVRIVTQILILIAAGVGAGIVGNMVAGAVRGAMVADAATASLGMLRAARVVGGVAGMTVDAGINTGVQLAVQGGDAKEAFVSNMLGSAAVRAALAPLQKAAQAWGKASQEVSNLSVWQKVGRSTKFAVKQGAILTTMMITGVATDYVVHRIYHSNEPPTEKQAVDWAIQGGSMAIGMFVGQWTHDFDARAVQLSEQFGYKTFRERTFNIKKISAKVAENGNPDTALELLVERQKILEEEARVIDEATKASKGNPSTLLETMRAANGSEQHAVREAAFEQVPLRLAGLEPDDATGNIWAGATEDIAIALHQAQRAGLNVEVLSHDTAARQWKVLFNGKEITILETKLAGRPRAAKAEVSDSDRVHAKRYAESAQFMQEKWEAKVKRDVDGLEIIEVDHLQVGYAYAGVVNQSTLPAQGAGLNDKLIVYKNKGTLSGRGEQELGQPPGKLDGPGVRATEQAPKDTPWIKSQQLDNALDIGRIENQTPAYRGEATALETPDKATPQDPWKASNRKFRLRIRDGAGIERWFYCDHYDNVGGLGPGSTKQLEKVVVDPGVRSSMMSGEHPMLLLGDDPDYVHKVKGGDILIWGGTQTGAWAAEPVRSKPGAHATVLGDTRPPADWPKLFDEFNDLKDSIAVLGDQAPPEMKKRLTAIEKMIEDAHSGSKPRRNRKPGATYEKPPAGARGPGDVRIEFGTPSRITPTDDGRVLVTIGTGENARTRIYDQVVVAHGQDPAKGPAALLGRGASPEHSDDPKTKVFGEVPGETIALRPVWGAAGGDGRRPILGLESINPPGIVLKGAAYANKAMSPWVAKSERAAFEAEVTAMSAAHSQTRDYGAVSEDSRTVSPGMEVQRDRIPRANEVLTAGKLRLTAPEKALELDSDESKWDDQLREFFAVNLRAADRWVSVKRLGGGKSKAVVYQVSVDGTDVGVFKLFDKEGGAVNEQRTLDMLKAAKLKVLKVVQGRGTVAVDPHTGFTGGVLMDNAQGTTVKEMIQSVPNDGEERARAIRNLRTAVEKVAEGLAEMHVAFGDNSSQKPAMMTEEAKRSDAEYFLEKAFKPRGRDYAKVRANLGSDFDRVYAVAEGRMYREFLDAEVPATAYHGDANAGNFALSRNNSDVTTFDVDSVQWSLPGGALEGNGGHVVGTKTGAADIARFLNSLETIAPGKLKPGDLDSLRNAFKTSYFKNYRVGSDQHRVNRASYEKAERWYQLEMELAILANDPGAKERVMNLVGLSGAP